MRLKHIGWSENEVSLDSFVSIFCFYLCFEEKMKKSEIAIPLPIIIIIMPKPELS